MEDLVVSVKGGAPYSEAKRVFARKEPMMLVEGALRERQAQGKPIRVGMIGAGIMGRAIAMQILRYTAGMELATLYSRHLEDARRAYREAGAEDPLYVDSVAGLHSALARNHSSITDDPDVICEADGLDALIEATGAVEFGARVVLKALQHGKPVILVSAQLAATLGPILKRYADRSGVVLTSMDGEPPGVSMKLYRFIVGIGAKPVLCGSSIEGLIDVHKNPDTEQAFAAELGGEAHIAASLSDGTRIALDQAVVANATGMRVAKRGMHGPVVPPCARIQEADQLFPLNSLLAGGCGIVDYVVGACAPGVFLFAAHDWPQQRRLLKLNQLGPGPLYCFYTPNHVCHLEAPITVARAVLFKKGAIAPLAGPRVDVVATAKLPLKAGQVLDGIGWYMTYGQAENSDVVLRERLLPIGLAENCRLRRDVEQDEVLRLSDVYIPENRLIDQLRAEQERYFFGNG